MTEYVCRGLPADWLNAWLAAVGATVLEPRLRLAWTDDPVPLAVLSAPEGLDPVELLVEAWPDEERIMDMPLAPEWRGAEKMRRTVTVEMFIERARLARGVPDSWSLSSTVTDLVVFDRGVVAHAPFDTGAPGGESLHDRLAALYAGLDGHAQALRDSLAGVPVRLRLNGLGFDLSRITGMADKASKLVDPAVEIMAFFGLALLPVRGDGVDLRMRPDRGAGGRRQRGWYEREGIRGRQFMWPVWSESLDACAIDALLDVWVPRDAARSSALGVSAAYASVAYQARATADPTSGYGARRLW